MLCTVYVTNGVCKGTNTVVSFKRYYTVAEMCFWHKWLSDDIILSQSVTGGGENQWRKCVISMYGPYYKVLPVLYCTTVSTIIIQYYIVDQISSTWQVGLPGKVR